MGTRPQLPLGAIEPRGWLLAQMISDLDHGFAGCLDGLTEHARRDLFTNRISDSDDEREWWDAETRGNWLWGLTMMSYLAGAPEHRARRRDRSLQGITHPRGHCLLLQPECHTASPPLRERDVGAAGHGGPFGRRALRPLCRGPLQYVLPVPAREERLRSYPVGGFFDLALRPADMGAAARIPILAEGERDAGVTVVSPADALRIDGAELLPLRCTRLRRAGFLLRRLEATEWPAADTAAP